MLAAGASLTEHEGATTASRTASARVVDILRRPRSARFQTGAVIVAIVILVGGTALALGSLPPRDELTWWPVVVLIVVGTPWQLCLLTLEVSLLGRIAGVTLARTTSLRVAVLGTAFNLLPIPGAVVTRLDALVVAGAGVGVATGAIIVVGVIWLSIALLIAGGVLIGTTWFSVLFLAAGVATGAGTVVLVRRSRRHLGRRELASVCVLESAFVLTHATRLLLAFVAVGVSAPLSAPLAMASSTAISTSLGIVPGGLGVREGLATFLGGVAGVAVGTALVVAVIDRAAAMISALLGGAVVLPLLNRHDRRSRAATTGESTSG